MVLMVVCWRYGGKWARIYANECRLNEINVFLRK